VLMLAPFVPHLAEELWERLGRTGGVVAAGWPTFDPNVARAEEVEIPVQVNGKVRGRVIVAQDASDANIEVAARAAPQIQPHLRDGDVVKVIVARGRLVNIVVRPRKAS
jgi:leucyl-tRNA synthetase